MDATVGEDAADFREAVASLRAVKVRSEIQLEESPAPQRLAPYALALSAEVLVDGDDLGTGRLVVLHDPDGQEAWEGTFRIVAFVKATLEPEMAADAVLTEVGWAWLVEALETHGARYRAISGTVTRVTSESFGALSDRPIEGQIELRASWSPEGEIAPHVEAWAELVCMLAGLPPGSEDIAVLGSHRGPRD